MSLNTSEISEQSTDYQGAPLIYEMEEGQVGYTLPWAIGVTSVGNFMLNPTFSFVQEIPDSSGDVILPTLKITKVNDDTFVADASEVNPDLIEDLYSLDNETRISINAGLRPADVDEGFIEAGWDKPVSRIILPK